ncbi:MULTISPECIES: PLDc N-terminal domain-containing protein [unclassified Devosia]|uniref:PLDc N-terminal domain-containing protein n=1 Tax=unclassified Devosia TaxID=196773 RepID=UPI0015570528|nr:MULTISPECIES: PLDc N-terminal domain-containing protein [unclassified Devosia]
MSSDFWEFLWLILWSFFLISYLMVLFQIIADIFRDRDLSGFAKAVWIIALLIFPVLTALVYLVVRGSGMTIRRNQDLQRMSEETENYIRSVAGRSPATEIADAHALREAGVISEDEFSRIKSKALA